MQKTRMLISSCFLLLISLSICSAQHWSYGFQPGGKRDVENLIDSFQEIENEMEKAGKLQPFECNVPRQHFTLRGLTGGLITCLFDLEDCLTILTMGDCSRTIQEISVIYPQAVLFKIRHTSGITEQCAIIGASDLC